jgi:hypothetical protein
MYRAAWRYFDLSMRQLPYLRQAAMHICDCRASYTLALLDTLTTQCVKERKCATEVESNMFCRILCRVRRVRREGSVDHFS